MTAASLNLLQASLTGGAAFREVDALLSGLTFAEATRPAAPHTLAELLAHLHRTMPERTSLLSTEPDNPARRLYRRAGYLELLPGFRYPITGSPAVVMGRRAG